MCPLIYNFYSKNFSIEAIFRWRDREITKTKGRWIVGEQGNQKHDSRWIYRLEGMSNYNIVFYSSSKQVRGWDPTDSEIENQWFLIHNSRTKSIFIRFFTSLWMDFQEIYYRSIEKSIRESIPIWLSVDFINDSFDEFFFIRLSIRLRNQKMGIFTQFIWLEKT